MKQEMSQMSRMLAEQWEEKKRRAQISNEELEKAKQDVNNSEEPWLKQSKGKLTTEMYEKMLQQVTDPDSVEDDTELKRALDRFYGEQMD